MADRVGGWPTGWEDGRPAAGGTLTASHPLPDRGDGFRLDAALLAGTAFPDLAMATVPGAIFSVWHNISGAILANLYNRWSNE